jgi:hypothetical protein
MNPFPNRFSQQSDPAFSSPLVAAVTGVVQISRRKARNDEELEVN